MHGQCSPAGAAVQRCSAGPSAGFIKSRKGGGTLSNKPRLLMTLPNATEPQPHATAGNRNRTQVDLQAKRSRKPQPAPTPHETASAGIRRRSGRTRLPGGPSASTHALVPLGSNPHAEPAPAPNRHPRPTHTRAQPALAPNPHPGPSACVSLRMRLPLAAGAGKPASGSKPLAACRLPASCRHPRQTRTRAPYARTND